MLFKNKKCSLILILLFSLLYGNSQKQFGISLQGGVSMIHYDYKNKPDTVSQSVSIMFDVGVNYNVYINKNWRLYFLLNYGRFHGRHNFEYELYLPQWPNIQQHVGRIEGYTRWWYLNTALHPFVLYSKEKMGVNIGFRFVYGILMSGKRHYKFYDLDGVLRNSDDDYNFTLSNNKWNFGPTLGLNYKITKNTFIYFYLYSSVNNLKNSDQIYKENWKLKQLVFGIEFLLF